MRVHLESIRILLLAEVAGALLGTALLAGVATGRLAAVPWSPEAVEAGERADAARDDQKQHAGAPTCGQRGETSDPPAQATAPEGAEVSAGSGGIRASAPVPERDTPTPAETAPRPAPPAAEPIQARRWIDTLPL